MVDVCYRPLNLLKKENEMFHKQLEELSQWLDFVLVQDFDLLKVQYKESRSFLQWYEAVLDIETM